MRRILDALRQIEEEAPGLVEDAVIAATELSKTRSDGGRVPQWGDAMSLLMLALFLSTILALCAVAASADDGDGFSNA
jgi:hypothetical protein